MRDIVNIIGRHTEHTVLLGMDTLGKEELMNAIQCQLGDTKVCARGQGMANVWLTVI